MPQLDILSFEGQMFWLYFFLFIMFAVMIFITLPSLMLTFRIRAKFLKKLTSLKEKEEVDVKKYSSVIKDDLEKKTIPVLNKVGYSVTLSAFYTQGKFVTENFIKYLEREELNAYLDAPKFYSALLDFVTPNDTFILMFSFITFSIIFYFYYSKTLISDHLDSRIFVIKQNYLVLNKARSLNLQGKLTIFKNMTALVKDKQTLIKFTIAILDKKTKRIENAFNNLLKQTFKYTKKVDLKHNLLKNYLLTDLLQEFHMKNKAEKFLDLEVFGSNSISTSFTISEEKTKFYPLLLAIVMHMKGKEIAWVENDISDIFTALEEEFNSYETLELIQLLTQRSYNIPFSMEKNSCVVGPVTLENTQNFVFSNIQLLEEFNESSIETRLEKTTTGIISHNPFTVADIYSEQISHIHPEAEMSDLDVRMLLGVQIIENKVLLDEKIIDPFYYQEFIYNKDFTYSTLVVEKALAFNLLLNIFE